MVSECTDNRTVAEQMRDLGVPIERPKDTSLSGVKWISRPHVHGVTAYIRLTQKGIYLTNDMAKDLDWRVMFGSGEYQKQKVILVKHDPKGYRLSGNKKSYPCAARPKVIKELLAAGLKPGRYEPVKIKGGWMGMPVEVE